MAGGLRIRPPLASLVLFLCVVASALGISFAGSLNGVAQVLIVLASMAVTFFASHPLGHFLWARAYGVRTQYFFVGRSDFRKLASKPASLLGGLVPTIGTKLRKQDLQSLTSRKRGYILGAGVIVSNALLGLELVFLLVTGFGLFATLVASAFFLATLATELLFSTKVGDLCKMTKEFREPSHRTPPP